MGKIIGIDLGTTNSCVAVVEGGRPVVIPNALGERVTPSVVRFLENGEIIVGEHAFRACMIDPKNTITGIKRFIGRRYNEVIDIAQIMPFNVVLGKNNLAMININGIEYSPQMISAMILQSLKVSAEDYLGEKVSDAVITIPAYFGDTQRQATKEAGEIAGLKVRRIINEPTAAALTYGLDRQKDQKIAVFDLGGGTFDITLLEMGDGVFDVKAIAGDGFLGGDDFDTRIADWILEEFKREHGIDLSEDPLAMQRVRETATKTKCELSQISEGTINIPFLAKKNEKPINLNLVLTRHKFEELCEELFERLVRPCEVALKDSWLTPQDIDYVIFVGGATRMPKVSEIVNRVFGMEPSKSVNPEEAVAIGAAIQGSVLGGDIKDVLLLDVTPRSLGVETEGGVITLLIERDTTIPCIKTEIFSTSLDNQTSVEINVLEGEAELVVDNRSLGRFILDGIPPQPRGVPQIEVRFDIDANGILNVSAKDKATNKQQSIRVEASTGLSKEEIAKMERNARDLAAEDKKKRELVEVRNHAYKLVYQTEKSIQDIMDKLNADEKTHLEASVKKIRDALNFDSTDEIRSAYETLNRIWNQISLPKY